MLGFGGIAGDCPTFLEDVPLTVDGGLMDEDTAGLIDEGAEAGGGAASCWGDRAA